MNPEIKKQWVDALRSGDYTQGQGSLTYATAAGVQRFCCLGVLCHLAEKAGIVEAQLSFLDRDTTYVDPRDRDDANDLTLPVAVQDWAGIIGPDVTIKGWNLTSWNDSKGASFSEIADLIEENL